MGKIENLNGPLFKEFPSVNTDDELQRLIHSQPGLDSYYVAAAACPDRRIWFEELWESYRDLADAKFISQAKVAFHSCSWEMYLAHILKLKGYRLSSSDTGPDLFLTDYCVYIEAIAAQPGSGEHRVPEIKYGQLLDLPAEKILLRLTSAFAEKKKKYDGYQGKLPVDGPRVIAINGGIFQYPGPVISAMLKVCFGIGDLAMSIPLGGGAVEPFYRAMPHIKKGVTEVSANLFLQEENSAISAVIYSPTDVLNSQDKLGTELEIIHNPLAAKPLSLDVFRPFHQYTWNRDRVVDISPQ